MNETKPWRIISKSVCGAAHKRGNKPNQDAVRTKIDSCGVAVAAVADGHGSHRYYRSDKGAFFAVEAVVERLLDCARPGAFDRVSLSELRHHAEVDLPQSIVLKWQDLVEKHREANPIQETEREPLTDVERKADEKNKYLAYGTTLVAALLIPECALYLQLGDGDILLVGASEEEVDRPVPSKRLMLGTETESMCSMGLATGNRPSGATGPWGDFRVRLVPTSNKPPALVLLTTDGYVNAFVDDAGFRKVATDLLTLGKERGWDYVEENLEGWLDEASSAGSGDDVTVAILVREDLREAGGGPPRGPPIAN